MEFIKKNIKWIGLGGLALGFIGLFLPFVTVSAELFGQTVFSQSIVFVQHDGIFVLIGIVACAVLLFLNKELFSLIPLGIGTAITLYDSFNMGKLIGSNSYEGVKVSFSVGFYFLLIGLIVAVAAICYNQFVLKKNNSTVTYNQNVQSNYNNQGYQPYNYGQPVQNNFTQPQQPMDSVYGQAVQNTAVDNLFNQSPVQANQPINNYVQQTQPVQNLNNPDVVTCPQCRSTLKSGMSFCNQCGSKLN